MTSSSSSLLFVIVGSNEPLFEVDLQASSQPLSDAATRQSYFVLHSALDLVERSASNQMYLKIVDKVNQQQVSTFLTAGNIKLMLLHNVHQNKSEDAIRQFFQDVYELYVKFSMNPFYAYDTPILSEAFDTRVRALGRKYLS
ncbi:hypothetical protein FisN_11Hh337 [Fistulifera solaris]|uniref:Trafficking protein particle complex subunit n=1 Tax=Fistulifera solaris TaxID=1519565 RepID=A0A1Z5K9E0_FISSO|nr:hypothetical protein FisN_11Hh337 [Fistulifera solaris]|eukprot:GAX22772.1 hypothetical protein FisN_11Hh337 [Fistulifera solaris]